METFPPRGSGKPNAPESLPKATWISPEQLGPTWDWKPGAILLGRDGDRELGYSDDRHVVTIAGSGGGKTSTVLKHNAARWPGSLIITDPKGEIARHVIGIRKMLGQRVYIFDPFGVLGEETASYNPFDELGFGRPANVAADAALCADAMIIQSKSDPHWTDAGRNLSRAAILLGWEKGLIDLAAFRRMISGTPAQLGEMFDAMIDSDGFDGALANMGTSLLGKLKGSPRELAGILSTVQEQTAAFDDLTTVTRSSDLRMADLRDGNITIILVLPGMRMATHYRWLRLMIQMAMAALERYPVPRGGTPVLFMLEEFAALGPMRSIESAAGLMRGYGLKLHAVLQDLTQLKTHYPESWETFLANAGVVQAFANADLTTTEYLSKQLGMTQVLERDRSHTSSSSMSHGDIGRREHLRVTRLLEPDEINRHFARETGRQLILVPGKRPIFMDRMDHFTSQGD